MESFVPAVLSCFIFLLLASFSLKPSEKWGIPHSVFLVLIGIIIALSIRMIDELSFLTYFELSPELIFFVFLPTLLFESSFKIPLRKIISDKIPIALLSILGYLISAAVITAGMCGLLILLGIDIPLLAILLFAVIISATDPVAVLSVFKQLGVTPRLTRIFEGESLFNDGTSWAAFLILIGFITVDGAKMDLFSPSIALLEFIVMIVGGIGFGILMGYLFSWLIQSVRTEETVQLTLTLIMAHITFLLADLSKHILHFGDIHFEISAIISTVVASMVLGSKGIQKFNPNVRKHMNVLWEHFAFISNSLIFILIGMMTVKVIHPENLSIMAIPIVLGIAVTVFARWFSVCIPISLFNLFAKKEKKLPRKWVSILSWASLRGAVAVAAVLTIPDSLSIPGWTMPISEKDFVTTMVISSILFTTFVKAMSLEYFVDKMELAKFSDVEKIEVLEGKILTITEVLKRLERLGKKKYISPTNLAKLEKEYKCMKKTCIRKLSNIFSKTLSDEGVEQFLHLHALAIEKKMLQIIIDQQEISEDVYWLIQGKILRQENRIKTGQKQIQGRHITTESIQERDIEKRYQISRARIIIISKVFKRLSELESSGLCIPRKPLENVKKRYKKWFEHAKEMRSYIEKKHPHISQKIEYNIFSFYAEGIEHDIVKRLNNKSILDERVYEELIRNGIKSS